jgi:hypothetical protein
MDTHKSFEIFRVLRDNFIHPSEQNVWKLKELLRIF